nr:Dihydrofolate reductase [uncultured bacterium]
MKVFLLIALTADGLIGRDAHHLADWSSREDKKLFVRLTKEAGVIVFGFNTFETIGRALPGRRMIVYTSDPSKITAQGVETTREAPADLVKRLKAEGANGLAVCGGASIYTQFMKAGVVDELYITIEPVMFGRGLTLFNDELEAHVRLLEVSKLNDNAVLLHYTVQKS